MEIHYGILVIHLLQLILLHRPELTVSFILVCDVNDSKVRIPVVLMSNRSVFFGAFWFEISAAFVLSSFVGIEWACLEGSNVHGWE